MRDRDESLSGIKPMNYWVYSVSESHALLFYVSLGGAYPLERLSHDVRDMDLNSVHILPQICVLYIHSSVTTQ